MCSEDKNSRQQLVNLFGSIPAPDLFFKISPLSTLHRASESFFYSSTARFKIKAYLVTIALCFYFPYWLSFR